METIDLRKELKEFYEENKKFNILLNYDDALRNSKGMFGNLFSTHFSVIGDGINKVIPFLEFHNSDEFLFGIGNMKSISIFYYNTFLLFAGGSLTDANIQTCLKVDYINIDDIKIETAKVLFMTETRYKHTSRSFTGGGIAGDSEILWKEIHSLITQSVNEEKRIEKEKSERNEQERLKNLEVSQSKVLSELDKDGNGEVDLEEGNDFNLLLKKHQDIIIKIDRSYIQQFVKVANYLKIKRVNIQSIFDSIKYSPNQKVLNEFVEILRDDINCYNLVVFNSLNMIISLVEEEMITFYEIYEMFDTLNMFDSKHEKDISQKLINIEGGLKDLMEEVRIRGNQISDAIYELSYVTEESNRQLTEHLSVINSTLKVGNLINGINAYQNYRANRQLK